MTLKIQDVPMKRFACYFVNQWCNPFTCNWFDFSIIRIEPEWDRRFGELSLIVVVLGVGFNAAYTYDMTTKNKMTDELNKWLEEQGLENEK